MTTPRKKDPTVSEAVAAFLGTLSPSTRRSYAIALDALAAGYEAGKPLASLDAAEVADWLTERYGDRSPATWNLRVASLRAAGAWWHERGWREDNLGEAIKVRKPRQVVPVEVLTPEEVHAILGKASMRAPTGVRNKALLTLLYRSGLRVSEAIALRVSDLNQAEHSVRVRFTKAGLAQTRGYHPSVDDALQRWLDKRRELGIRANGNPLFCTLEGKPLSARYVGSMLARYARRAGVSKRVHPHGLRHTYADELRRAGVDVVVISQLLGHSSIAITSRYLDHMSGGFAVRLLEGIELPELPALPGPGAGDDEEE